MLLGIALAAPVGPLTLEMIKRGVQYGFFCALAIGMGGMSADALFMALIYLGISHILTIPAVHLLLFLFGSLFLGYLAYESVKSMVHSKEIDKTHIPYSKNLVIKCYLTGLTIALINPINILFWFGIYGSVLSESTQSGSLDHILVQTSFIFLGILTWNVIISVLAKLTSFVLSKQLFKWIHGFAAVLLMYYSLHFAVEFLRAMLAVYNG
ncbi:LysE family transporter [Alkalihalophilus sp. As8PL]|uniref:LysE family transporter n=1 Tax=Alkalihalophilus sp. As8PL TaxID=3237103 RepID=A0AB39BZP6_9BACI